MLVNGEEPSSPTSNVSSDLTALLEQELDAISLPGSPRHSGLAEAPDKDPRKNTREKSIEPTSTRLLKRPRSGLLTNEAEEDICPPHPGYMHGMCIRCGAVSTEEASEGVALRYIHTGLRLSNAEAERVRQKSSQRVINNRKLLLVLDLDHTLLNSTRFEEVSDEDRERLTQLLKQQGALTQENEPQNTAEASETPQEEAAAEHSATAPMMEQTLYCLTHMGLWTKLRPFVREFLAEAHKISEMHIYTHGNAEYAAEMARLLDPTKQYFAERIISQGDSTLRHVKDLDVVLGAEKSAIIMDDTSGVWPLHQPNLLLVERYVFFPADARRFGLARPALLHQGRDEAEAGGMLESALAVLQKVHARIFGPEPSTSGGSAGSRRGSVDGEEGDVRQHLAAVQREVLAGVRITFSRIIPQGDPAPNFHHIWRLAEQYGASVTLDLDDDVTHVVAAGPLTQKVKWAQRHGRHVVSPAWLQATACLWRRPDERSYPIDGPSNQPYEQRMSEEADTLAALASAGGGLGAVAE